MGFDYQQEREFGLLDMLDQATTIIRDQKVQIYKYINSQTETNLFIFKCFEVVFVVEMLKGLEHHSVQI